MTAKLTIELPVEAFSALRRSPEEFGHQMRVAAAIHWYSNHEVSMEKAALIAGMNRRDFLLELSSRRIEVFDVNIADLRRELDA